MGVLPLCTGAGCVELRGRGICTPPHPRWQQGSHSPVPVDIMGPHELRGRRQAGAA